MTRICLIILPLLLLPFAGSSPPPAYGCAPAPPKNAVVEVASESAIIIWDEKNQMQHFIRRATFTTSEKLSDFGFLVPTPRQPKITEAEDKAFDVLAEVTAPKIETHPKPTYTGCGCGSAPPGASATKEAGQVVILEANRVGNLDYQVLQATNAQGLSDWLKDRGYEMRPALTQWLEQYVTKGWIITAFKIAKDEKSEGAATKAVCMSFPTDKPFFPYREPADMRDAKGKRLLRVFFIGEGKAYALQGATPWVAKIPWAGQPNDEQWAKVLPLLRQPELNLNNWWLTEFEDPSSPRPGDNDVTFTTKGGDQAPVTRPPTIMYTSSNSEALPAYVGIAAIVACFICLRVLRCVGNPSAR